MIDISSGSTPSTTTTRVTADTSVDSLSTAITSKLDAVVQVVKANVDSGQLEKPAWDILLKLNPSASNVPAAPATSITPDIMRMLQAGKALLLQTQSSQLIPAGTRLQVNVSAAQGVQIQQIQMPNPLPALQLTQLKQWIPQQQAVLPLLANLLHLLQQHNQTQLATLPMRVQVAIQQVIAALPDPGTVRNPGQLQALVENSGILQEAKLAQALKHISSESRSAMQSKTASNSATPDNAIRDSINKTNINASAIPAVAKTLQQISQQVRHWVQHIQPDTKPSSATPGSSRASNAQAEPANPLNKILHQDLKQTLQQLEKHLQAANSASAPTPAESSKNNAAANTSPAAADESQDIAPDETGNLPLKKAEQLPDNLRRSYSNNKPDAASTTTTQIAKSPLAIQRYQASAQAGSSPKIQNDASATPDLIPPLPGQIVVQAQPRAHASLKSDDMADAIVKTLLSQVRGALARVTAHQLSSHSARQDSATPTSLSFEIPFLHNGQVELFQFRVEEEEESAQEKKDASQGKRWVVQMGFDIEGLGPMFCQLSLTGKSMAVNFWAAWEQTLSSTKAHFTFLEQALESMGIRVEKIQAQLGMPDADKTGVRNQLVDIKT